MKTKQFNNKIVELEHFEGLYPENTRFDEIEKIISFVKEGNSCQVISLAGVGRSNLLGLLAYNRNVRIKHLSENQKNYHFVLLNFSEIRKRPLADATKFIFLGILDSLRERGFSKRYEKVNQIFKESVELNDELVLFTGLKKTIDYLTIEKNLTVILLFDRFEEYVPMLSSEFFANLRVLRNRAKFHFSVVFSLNRPLEDLIEPSLFADFFEYVAGRIIYLPIYDKEGLGFRISYLERVSGKKLDKKTADKVLALTNGHGRITILILETLLSLSKSLKTDKELINYLLTQRPIRSALFAIWNLLTPSEQQCLTEKGEEYPEYLENVGILQNGKITIPIFSEFVKQEVFKKIKFAQKEEIIFNENTNEIKKGEAIISDILTSSEFKLLRFLILEKNKILDKEQIINAVWGEKTTTLGVTDQALDQLVFRLRKKIEQNPNKPKHILTIKGRGVKFSN